MPYQTHRYLVEPVSGQLHLKKLLIKRFLSFISQIKQSDKQIPKQLLHCSQLDTRSVTGSNLRRILLLTKKTRVEDINDKDIKNIEFDEISEDNYWRVKLIQEITDIKFGQVNIDGFSKEECDEIL